MSAPFGGSIAFYFAMTISINWSRKSNFQRSPASSMGSRVFVMNFPTWGTWNTACKNSSTQQNGTFCNE